MQRSIVFCNTFFWNKGGDSHKFTPPNSNCLGFDRKEKYEMTSRRAPTHYRTIQAHFLSISGHCNNSQQKPVFANILLSLPFLQNDKHLLLRFKSSSEFDPCFTGLLPYCAIYNSCFHKSLPICKTQYMDAKRSFTYFYKIQSVACFYWITYYYY